jgi:hypothetical protein
MLDLGERFFGGGAADLGPRASTETLGDLEAELNPPVGHRGVERLRVRIRDDEVDALDVSPHHVGDGVAACPADADHADPRAKLVDLRPHEIDAHVPKPPPNTATRWSTGKNL